MGDLKKCKDLCFDSFDSDLFLTTCILGGCDYLESIKGIGFKKAHKYVTKACGDLEMIIRQLKLDQFKVPENYLDSFNKAFLTFHFQVVYCPKSKRLVYLSDPKTSLH